MSRLAPEGRGGERSSSSEEGSALVEFVALALLVMIPLIYIVMAVARVQSAAYAVTTAVREAGRVYATSATDVQGRQRAAAAARLALADHGFELTSGALQVRCAGGPCLAPGTRVEVSVRLSVPLPFLPQNFERGTDLSVPVSADHVEVIETYRESE